MFCKTMKPDDHEKLVVNMYVKISLFIGLSALEAACTAILINHVLHSLYLVGINYLEYHMRPPFFKEITSQFLNKTWSHIILLKYPRQMYDKLYLLAGLNNPFINLNLNFTIVWKLRRPQQNDFQ